MALGTLLYGFLALLLSCRVACQFVADRWALLATVTIWWASSLPVYMYFNPSWSHAHSAFAVTLFFWYWLRTRDQRGTRQWIVLALIGALMMNVYYPNVLVLVALIPEALASYRSALMRSSDDHPGLLALIGQHGLFCLLTFLGLFPTFLSKYIIYGGVFESGYIPVTLWAWRSPWFLSLLFSANHGLFSWTPVLLIATAGLFVFWRRVPAIGTPVLCVLLAFYYFMAAYPDWAGISSFGNRFFVSLTVFFVLGLAVAIDSIAVRFRNQRTALVCAAAGLSLFVVWNLGLIFQWGAHLIPARGPVSWSQVIHNQFQVVPRQLASQLESYLFRRKDALHQIEQRDLEQLNHAAQP